MRRRKNKALLLAASLQHYRSRAVFRPIDLFSHESFTHSAQRRSEARGRFPRTRCSSHADQLLEYFHEKHHIYTINPKNIFTFQHTVNNIREALLVSTHSGAHTVFLKEKNIFISSENTFHMSFMFKHRKLLFISKF